MKLAATRELYHYWNVVRRTRAAPERADFDPTAIRESLADVFILEVDAAGRWPVRLAGTRLEAAFGPLEARSLLDLWPDAAARREVARLLRGVADDQQAAVAGVLAEAPDGASLDYELLALPLRDGGRTHSRLIGALAASRPPDGRGARPLRLGALTTLRILRADETGASARAASRAPARRRAHLVVYEGGKA